MKNVLVTGSFDLLHSGHVTFLKEAAKYGHVYVGIGSDKSIESLKNRPTINPEQERLYMVKAIRYVDDAWINTGMGNMDFAEDFEQDNPLHFDILLVSEDQDFVEKREFCNKYRMEYIVLPRIQEVGLPIRSSTSMRKLTKMILTQNPFPIKQNLVEITQFVEFIETIQPANIMEIGVWTWGTSWIWFQFCKKNDGLLYALDYRKEVFEMAKWPPRVKPIFGDSTNPLIIKRIHDMIPTGTLDLLFIDADHTLPYVTQDYENYKDLVRKGGIIAFHDIVEPSCEVRLLWNQIKTETSLEFCDPIAIRDMGQTSGIGAIIVNG